MSLGFTTRDSKTVRSAGMAIPRPTASSSAVRFRMQATRQRDTPREIELRRLLHRQGYRYRVDRSPIAGIRSRADLVFTKARVAVFVDGCFWHGCPKHGTWPKTNASWWRSKIKSNINRDIRTNRSLTQAGWRVVRVWAHEQPSNAASRVASILERRRTL